MSWTIEVKPQALKQYKRLDRRMRTRIKKGLSELEKSKNPLNAQHVKSLTGQLNGDYRLRVGEWRVLFTPDRQQNKLYVYAILPRGSVY